MQSEKCLCVSDCSPVLLETRRRKNCKRPCALLAWRVAVAVAVAVAGVIRRRGNVLEKTEGFWVPSRV
jgi:hypothetical protein